MDPAQLWHILNDPNYTEATLDDPNAVRIVVETVVDSESGDMRLVGRPPTIEEELEEIQELIEKAKGQLDRCYQANRDEGERDHLLSLIDLLEQSEDLLHDLFQKVAVWPEDYENSDQCDLGGEC